MNENLHHKRMLCNFFPRTHQYKENKHFKAILVIILVCSLLMRLLELKLRPNSDNLALCVDVSSLADSR